MFSIPLGRWSRNPWLTDHFRSFPLLPRILRRWCVTGRDFPRRKSMGFHFDESEVPVPRSIQKDRVPLLDHDDTNVNL